MNDDFFVDDVLGNLGKAEKKRVNSKDKGRRGEQDLCILLRERFQKPFSRVVSSGARVSQVQLSEQAKQVLIGDIVAPEGFRFTIECKYGYADLDLSTSFDVGIPKIDAFLKQATTDAARIGRLPMLCWRKPRQNWLAFIPTNVTNTYEYRFKLYYREWTCVSLSELLKQDDDFFFGPTIVKCGSNQMQ
jgi:hypothetical protein